MESDSSFKEEDEQVTYPAAAVPPEVRVFIGRVASDLQEAGVSLEMQRKIFSKNGYEISESTFRRLRKGSEGGGTPLSDSKSSGRPRVLTERQLQIFIGWALLRNDSNEIVDLAKLVTFIQESFLVVVAPESVRRWLVGAGFTSQKARRRTEGYKISLEGLIDVYCEDVQKFWDLGVREMRGDAVCCMDMSQLGWRLLSRKTFSLRGGQQPRTKIGNPSYTNTVAWAVFKDGVNRCPALLFTSDPQFTERSRVKDRRDGLFKVHNIDPSRIVICNSGNSVGENRDVVTTFLNRYPFLKNILILTDRGNAYKKKDVDIIREWGGRHEAFTPAVHEFMSVLDNWCFGIAKGKFRSSRVNENDRLEPSLIFLNALDSIEPDTIRRMWDRNFLLRQETIDRDTVREIIKPLGQTEISKQNFYNECRDAYRTDVQGLKPLYSDAPPAELADTLDGGYWKKQKTGQ